MTHLQGVPSPLTHLLKLGENEFYNSRLEGPSIELILWNMTLTQKAQHLMSKTQCSNPYLLLLQALHALTRFKGQSLFNILNESKGIALALYHKEKPEPQKTKVNKLMLHCLLSFTAGTVRAFY